MLQNIVKTYKKKSWVRMCSLNKIDPWDLITHLNEPVYRSRYLICDGLELKTRNCLQCGAKLKLGIYKESFIASTTCNCANDGTNLMTEDKLRTVFDEDQVQLAIIATNNKKRNGLPNTIDFWITKGFTLEQAQMEVAIIQKQRSDKSPAAQKGARGYSIRTIEYWLKKGLDETAAREKIREVQTTNGLEYYKAKYGAEGEDMFNNRIEKWLNSPGNKSMIANRSKKSLNLFEQLGVGQYGEHEQTVRGKKKVHRVDFLHGKKIIEFYGDYWHGNPDIYDSNSIIRKKKITDVWEHDARKVQDLKDNGYEVMIVWEKDYKFSPEVTVQKCKDFIKC